MTREIVVVSGKGGTGKSSVTAAFSQLAAAAEQSAVLCDLDVDAADLHVLLRPEVLQTLPFSGGKRAVLDPAACNRCGRCVRLCRFGAVARTDAGIVIDPRFCEGCGVCAHFCRRGAIAMQPRASGQWFRSRVAAGPMLHAELYPGEENSGKLVTLLRQEARTLADAGGVAWVLADGPPGVGCPVIAAISGAHRVVIVTEPTVAALHDLERIADLCAGLKVPAVAVVNKAGLDDEMRLRVLAACAVRGIEVLGEIPFSPVVVRGLVARTTLDRIVEDGIAAAIHGIWRAVVAHAERNLPPVNMEEIKP